MIALEDLQIEYHDAVVLLFWETYEALDQDDAILADMTICNKGSDRQVNKVIY
jgi:hypothetical protein